MVEGKARLCDMENAKMIDYDEESGPLPVVSHLLTS